MHVVDASALESLDAINARLLSGDVKLHLSEVKGPVKDRLSRVSFLDELSGQVFLSQFEALRQLAPECLTPVVERPAAE